MSICRFAPSFAALLCLLAPASCSGPGRSAPRPEPFGNLTGAAVDLPTRPDLLEIKALEVARSTGEGRLEEYLRGEDPTARRHAARALGRLPLVRHGDDVTAALCEALADSDPEVRAEAAFALGIRGDAGGRAPLVANAGDPDERVRARVVEALTKIGGDRARVTVLRAFADPSPAVRQEAIVGVARWGRDEPGADEVDARLLSLLAPRAAVEITPAERWRVLYALQRRRAPQGAGAFLAHHLPTARAAADTAGLEHDVNARLFAVRGLARLDPTGQRDGVEARPELTRALERALEDVDWRIAVEAALGLGAHGDPASIPALEARLSHKSPHVRRAVVQALGRFVGASAAVAGPLSRGLADVSLSVRAEALVALARVLPARDSLVTLERLRADPEQAVRAGVARAAALLPADTALGLLEPLSRDPRTFVSTVALQSLGELADARADTLLREVVDRSPDTVMVQIACESLGRRVDERDLDRLEARVSEFTEAAAPPIDSSISELTNTLLSVAETVRGERALEVARELARHFNPYVAERAGSLCETLGASPPTAPWTEPEPASIPVAGRDHPLWRTNPLVAVETNRGTMVFELFPEEAPLHVHNLLALAESGHYADTTFHRVELDFVIQGGDLRGDGAGGASWRGGPLQHEFGTRPYRRGSLGMPRWADPDSGGSQLFVTHRPTPHLDGRYTLFGQLVRGWDVLDAVEVGDRIRKVELLTP